MKYKLIKKEDVEKKGKYGANLDVYPNVNDCGIVLVSTETGHNEEFSNLKSTFTYVILDGEGSFFLDDEEVSVEKGDMISIEPNTRIYYKGKLNMVLITNPAWRQENEFETKARVW
jgi:mannose-6-phosphate isomerase-like protein (cupin superfamily)